MKGVKVLNDCGRGQTSSICKGLDAVARSFVRPAIASMSLGGSGRKLTYRSAVDAAVNRGVTVVVAAGNDNSNACNYSPAYVPSAITVGSTDSRGARSGFSNFGSCADIWAPGSSITSAAHISDTGRTVKSGTSMACPHVAGAAALVLQYSPTMRSSGVLQALLDRSARNSIAGLRSGDTNALIHVGQGAAPPAPSQPPPMPVATCNSAFSSGPDSKTGDCRCKAGTDCFYDGQDGCPFNLTAEDPNVTSYRYFSVNCTGCTCETSDRESGAPRGAQIVGLLGAAMVLLQHLLS